MVLVIYAKQIIAIFQFTGFSSLSVCQELLSALHQHTSPSVWRRIREDAKRILVDSILAALVQ